jgi:phospholipase C
MGPIVTQSSGSDDFLTGNGSCGDGSKSIYQGQCGYGPRMPLLVISPYAKVNYVDHNVTDLSSILRLIEDNWNLGRIGGNSADAFAGSLMGMFNFGAVAPAVLLDPSKGTVVGSAAGGSGSPSASGATKAVAGPKNLATTITVVSLDGTASTSYDGKPLTYQWSVSGGSMAAQISNANTATPLVYREGLPGPYTFTLTVTDDAGNTSTDTTTVWWY